MKLIVQIPCHNEAETLPRVVAEIPRHIEGIEAVEVLVIDDGSTDDTVRIAYACGVDHVVSHPYRRGLAAAFQTGLDTALGLGADIVVNTDGDHQYPGAEIPRLLAPILNRGADLVIGDRQPATIGEFSPLKRALQVWGSWIVRLASGTQVPDATSGFRAYSREAALRLNVFTRYTYTLETIIQAGKKGLRVAHIVVPINPKLRPSRLVRNNWDYVKRSAATIVRLYTLYEPLRTFAWLSLPFIVVGLALVIRFLYFYIVGDAVGVARFVQSVVIGSAALIMGLLVLLFGVLADLVGANRWLLEDIMYRVKRLELEHAPDDHSMPPPTS
jgi:glycosyltransferase involved in cell wall biosynthesis